MLLLLSLFPVLRANRPAPHLQDRQPDLVVAPRDGPRAPRARDPAVGLTATPGNRLLLIGFLLLLLLLLLAVGRVTQVTGVKAESIAAAVSIRAGVIQGSDGFEDLCGKVADVRDLSLGEVSRGVALLPAPRRRPR